MDLPSHLIFLKRNTIFDPCLITTTFNQATPVGQAKSMSPFHPVIDFCYSSAWLVLLE